MHTPKWYPTVGELKERLSEAHWEVIDEHPAPPLKLSSAELGRRYGLNMPMLESITRKLLDQFGNIDHVFQHGENEFVAHLHYRIFASGHLMGASAFCRKTIGDSGNDAGIF